MADKRDLIDECLSDLPAGERDPKALQETCCAYCRNPECVNARWAMDKFSARVQAQPDRMLKPRQADPKSSRYSHLHNFVDMLQEAIKLESADRRGDWTVPEVPVLDGKAQVSQHNTTDVVDGAVRALAAAKGKDVALPNHREADKAAFVTETEQMMTTMAPPETAPEAPLEAPAQPPAPLPPEAPPTASVAPPKAGYHPPMANTPTPRGGIMIGEGPAPQAPVPRPQPVDPWTPVKKVPVVQPGAKIQMGKKDADDNTK